MGRSFGVTVPRLNLWCVWAPLCCRASSSGTISPASSTTTCSEATPGTLCPSDPHNPDQTEGSWGHPPNSDACLLAPVASIWQRGSGPCAEADRPTTRGGCLSVVSSGDPPDPPRPRFTRRHIPKRPKTVCWVSFGDPAVGHEDRLAPPRGLPGANPISRDVRPHVQQPVGLTNPWSEGTFSEVCSVRISIFLDEKNPLFNDQHPGCDTFWVRTYVQRPSPSPVWTEMTCRWTPWGGSASFFSSSKTQLDLCLQMVSCFFINVPHQKKNAVCIAQLEFSTVSGDFSSWRDAASTTCPHISDSSKLC